MRATLVALAATATLRQVVGTRAVLLSRFSGLDTTQLTATLGKACGPLSSKKLVYVPTASYVLSETSEKPKGEQRRRMRYEAKQKSQLLVKELGLDQNSKATLLELDAPNLKAEEIRIALENADICYVDGGNTFYLQYMLLRTKFWDIANPLLESGRLLYMGASAGGIVAGLSIETAYWKGWDKPIPIGMGMDGWSWTPETLRGRGLVPYSLFMHFDESAHAALVSQKKSSLDHEVMCISDDRYVLAPPLAW